MGLEKCLRAERMDGVTAVNWRGHSHQGSSHRKFWEGSEVSLEQKHHLNASLNDFFYFRG